MATSDFDAAVRRLRDEASEHGDHDQYVLCQIALGVYEHDGAPGTTRGRNVAAFLSQPAARSACADILAAESARRAAP